MIYIQNYLKPFQTFVAYSTPLASKTLEKISLIAAYLSEQRDHLAEFCGARKYEILTGISIGLSLYWLYSTFFQPPENREAKARPPIPYPKN